MTLSVTFVYLVNVNHSPFMGLQIRLKGTAAERKSTDTSRKAELPIIFRYSYKGSDTIIATGRKRQPAFWDFEHEVPTGKGAESLKRILDKISADIKTAIDKVELEGEEPTPQIVRERYLLLTGKQKRINATLLDQWERFINDRKGHANKAKSIETRTALSEQASRDSFKNFLLTNKRQNITLNRLTAKDISDYEKYLAEKKPELTNEAKSDKQRKQFTQPYSANTIAKKLKHLKSFLESQGSTLAESVVYKEVPVENVFLTRSELEAFQNFNFTSARLEKVRDLFLLTCHTGLRISDRKRLQAAHIADDMITIRAEKTDKLIKMPITPSIRGIIEKYNGNLPEISDQKFNDYLKECARLCIPDSKIEITENGKKVVVNKADILSSHDGIKTFATLKAGMGMSITSIAYLLGKSVAVILRSYIGVDHEKAFEDALRYDFSPLAVSK